MNRRALFGFLGGALIAPYAIKRLPVPVELPAPVPPPDPGLSAKYSLAVNADGYITGLSLIGKRGPDGKSFVLDIPKARVEPALHDCQYMTIVVDKFKILPPGTKPRRAPATIKIEAV